jgi:Mg2+ and Co2+ transporter CorA
MANEYITRELANIELQLEETESTFQELELRLKELYIIRRRCNKYRELVTEAVLQCKQRGKALWPSSRPAPDGNADAITFAESHAQELEGDLQYVLDHIAVNISRVEKNIKLLTALVTISEGRQGLQESRGIALLTLVAATFLPTETVATILGLQTRYSPGASKFWVLWAVALPLTVLVFSIPFSLPTVSMMLNQLRPKRFQAKPETMFQSPSESKDEDIERAMIPSITDAV